MTNTELVTRMNILGGMNKIILEDIGDEEITEKWLMCGVPDGADEDDLREIAEDDELFDDIIACFSRCFRAYKVRNIFEK